VYFVTLLLLFRRLLRDVGLRRLRREAALAAEAAEAAALLGAER